MLFFPESSKELTFAAQSLYPRSARISFYNTIAPACVDRSGGPAMKPKPGDFYETGADGAAGWPWGPNEADGWHWGSTAGPGRSMDMPWSPSR